MTTLTLEPLTITDQHRWDGDTSATHGALLRWGALYVPDLYDNTCVSCGGAATQSLPVVSKLHAGDAYLLPSNRVRCCDDCAARWRMARPAEQAVAAVILRNGWLDPLAHLGIRHWTDSGDDRIRPDIDMPYNPDEARAVKRRLLMERDGYRCRLCHREGVPVPNGVDTRNTTPPEGKAWLTTGHILPQWTSGRAPHIGWQVPKGITYDQGNVVASCIQCNAAIGPAVPPLPVAFRFLVKAWLPR